ncbi:MAG: aminotransferase class V-fold PLP-dependent enzyme [Eubacteriales bacterium]|nr:aminotransferase class V-fold PLP-dependent enzyme [Eubacteriales bacterium]
MTNYDETIKKEFGFLDSLIHVNVCSVGVIPKRTQNANASFMDQYLHMVYDVNNVDFEKERRKAKIEISKLINADMDELAYTKNTTEGTSVIACGYPLGKDDNVVVIDQEDESNIFPWINGASKNGYDVKIVKTDGKTLTEEMILKETDSHTRIVALSAVESLSGIRLDLSKLSKSLSQKGILLSVDGIQAIGRLNVDVKRDGIAFLSCGGFKGLMSGFGTGFLYCRKDLISKIIPSTVGSGSVVEVGDGHSLFQDKNDFALLPTAGRFEGGSFNTLGIILMGESSGLINELGIQNIEKHIISLEKQLRKDTEDIKHIEILPSGELPSGMIVAYYDDCYYSMIDNILKGFNVSMTHRQGYLRMSIGMHNTPGDIKIISKMLHTIDALYTN